MCFDVENECIRKKFLECNTWDFFYHEHERNLVLGIFLGCLYPKIFQMPTYLMSFIIN